MAIWATNQRVCATCRYWMGKREINYMNTIFNVYEDKSKCGGPIGSFKGAIMHSGASCNCWGAF